MFQGLDEATRIAFLIVKKPYEDYNLHMIQKTYKLNNIDEIADIAIKVHGEPVCENAGCKVLLAWAQIWDVDGISEFKRQVTYLFSDFIIIGSNHCSSSDILDFKIDGSTEEKGCLLSFLFFEQSGAELYHIKSDPGDEITEGQKLKALIEGTKDPRGVYLVPSNYSFSTEDVLEELKDLRDIPIFGIKTSLYETYTNFGYVPGKEVVEKQLLALIFSGADLDLRVHYNLGWTPVGKVMTVTKEENHFFVDEIDGKNASYVYNKYLGLRDDQIIPQNLSEFPLIIDRDGVKMSRIGISGPKPGQLLFGAPVHLNEKISLSYGNPDDLFAEVTKDSEEISVYKPQACLLIVCANRVMLLKNRETEEVDLYKKYIKSLEAVYGYGEIFYLDGKGGEMNSALVSVAFKETGDTGSVNRTVTDDADDTAEDINPSDTVIVPFTDRLSRMFKEMSADLIEAIKESEDANRAKSVFYSTVSHEIRTPLNSILGMNEMILKESSDEDIIQYSENIKSSGKLLQQLINDILDTGKIEAGKMEIIPVNYNVRKAMDELAAMISLSANEKGLELKYQPENELSVDLYGDEKRIRQCILNLLSNAVKYTREGKVVFKVGAADVDDEHVRLTVSVKDSGIGIKPEDIEKLSIPFERVDTSKNYKVEGTGLGLNIVNNLLGLMGSRLEIKSTYGKGSEFSFSIIQEKAHMDDSGIENNGNENPADGAWGSLKTRDVSILVVDDVIMNLRLVRLFLKDSGIDIDTSQEGALAIEMAANKKYDIIFLDRRMPGIDGLEVYKKITADRSGLNADSVFIMLTAEDGDGIREEFINEGFEDYLPKPFQPVMLEDIIRKHLPEEKIV